jgi:beta-glucosidase
MRDGAHQGDFDLVGFSYYSAAGIGPSGEWGPWPADATPGPMGYVPWAEGLREVLHRLAEELPGMPLLVSECGLGTDDDDARAEYLRECLAIVEEALADGIDVRGFFHWTGVDNYEWGHGFDVAFGLFDRDRNVKGSVEVLESATR